MRYALWQERTNRWFNGVDGKYHPPRPKMSKNRLTLYRTAEEARSSIPDHTDLEIIEIYFERTGK